MDETERKINDLSIHFFYLKADHEALKERLTQLESKTAKAITPATLKTLLLTVAGIITAIFTINKSIEALSLYNIKNYEKEKFYDEAKQHGTK